MRAINFIKGLLTKRRLLVIGAIILVFAIASAVTYLYQQQAVSAICDGSETNATYKSASNYLNPTATQNLGTIVKTIEASRGYEKDPNCMYIALTYYLNISDAEKARQRYDKFAAVYDQKEGLVKVLSSRNVSAERLKSDVELLETTETQAQKNSEAFGQPSGKK